MVGVKFIVYISLFYVDKFLFGFVDEYIEMEKMLVDFGIVYILLCNGWYIENYFVSVLVVLEHGVFIGVVGDGKIVLVMWVDYVVVVVRVISEVGYEGKVYELVGDSVWMLI